MDPKQRPTAEELLKVGAVISPLFTLQHEFLSVTATKETVAKELSSFFVQRFIKDVGFI